MLRTGSSLQAAAGKDRNRSLDNVGFIGASRRAPRTELSIGTNSKFEQRLRQPKQKWADLCNDMIYCFQLFEQKKIFCVHNETVISSNNRKTY